MTVKEVYLSFLKDVKELYDSNEASNITSMIFEHFAGIDRATLIKDPSLVLDKKTIDLLDKSLSEIKMHKPVQYITGHAWFYKMKLKVSPAVLIPRPETEELVTMVVDHLKVSGKRPEVSGKKLEVSDNTFEVSGNRSEVSGKRIEVSGTNSGANIIDIGTGSGCIAIAIKKSITNALVSAIDISPDALIIASENAANEFTQIQFLLLDFLSEENWPQLKKYDVIVSNPPYIPANESGNMDKNVTGYEPHAALFVDSKQPLIFYEKIALFAEQHLQENGKIFLETHEDFAEDVYKIFDRNKYDVVIKKDLFGKQRFVTATRFR